jgi:mannose-6-phosphate isomerase-like protein (cupin superfamily)
MLEVREMEVTRAGSIVKAGRGRSFRFAAGNGGDVKASRPEGLGFGFMHTQLPVGTGMPLLHLHRSMDEGFEVLRGRIEFRIGTGYEVAEAGDSVLIPAGVPHCFRALEPAELVLITSGPEGPDAIADLAGGNLMDMDWTASVLERYDTELLERHPHWGPPPR